MGSVLGSVLSEDREDRLRNMDGQVNDDTFNSDDGIFSTGSREHNAEGSPSIFAGDLTGAGNRQPNEEVPVNETGDGVTEDQRGATGATGSHGISHAWNPTMNATSARCLICLGMLAVYKLRDLITKEGLVNRPPSCPPNVWRDRNWFVVCLTCFAGFLKDPAPSEEAQAQAQNDFDWDWDFDLLDGPLSSIEEDVFWGEFREQRITEYLEELGQLIFEELEPYNFENSQVFQDEFWNNAEF